MFLTDAQLLNIIGQFAVIGLVLGFLYDILRFIRITFSSGRVFTFITDFFSMIFNGLVLLYFAIDTPTGNLRLIYVIAAVFGMVLYLITIGRITGFLAGFTNKFVTMLKRKTKAIILKPINKFYIFIKQKSTRLFGELHQKINIYKEKSVFGLKKAPILLYNEDNNKMSKLCQNGGEERNVIKAKIRKKA
ncbi:MAG: spore cortex biosynthesis protein YabQ [Oscillospiraceae bacterium]|nr:spore cortex biosynthesis protein YabQ [Oscillospiraceae bacterium]